MPRHPILLYLAGSSGAPGFAACLARELGLELRELRCEMELLDSVNRSFPALLLLGGTATSLQLCATLKRDPFTAVVPTAVYLGEVCGDAVLAAMSAGADEVVHSGMVACERVLRMRSLLSRSDRDLGVHPTTRLPGTVLIERDIGRRMREGGTFAVCYADLDHFKEFNDRYGYHRGDAVIRIVSRILSDVVRGRATDGFVGHIGGDDFIFNVPLEHARSCCEDVITVADELLPLQYDDVDRVRGCYPGKDRRGEEFLVPLMTISIGVVTNEQRSFCSPAEVSKRATEMKALTKQLPGSNFLFDQRMPTSSATAVA